MRESRKTNIFVATLSAPISNGCSCHIIIILYFLVANRPGYYTDKVAHPKFAIADIVLPMTNSQTSAIHANKDGHNKATTTSLTKYRSQFDHPWVANTQVSIEKGFTVIRRRGKGRRVRLEDRILASLCSVFLFFVSKRPRQLARQGARLNSTVLFVSKRPRQNS